MLAARLAVVTGGGSGIGKAICQKLAEQGARVLVADLRKETAESTAKALKGENHLHFAVNVAKEEEVANLQKFIETIPNSPEILINCAGITRDSTLLKMSTEQWKEVVDVNLTSVFLMSKMLARLAISNEKPLSIVNVSSIVGKIGNFGQTNYAATKAGVVGFTKSAAKELAKKNIRVNSILPGFIATPMTEKMPEKVLQAIIATIPQGKMGSPEDIANAALFLASDQSSYITGATLEVTGGFAM
ncbi:unnamed protein product [Caenorhabditis angaria]|uniref:(3R)-3-hydroxyacyl-CoA dehydrogenase n=1 Tax=Caenorhabditis angaria TaxID=860376 RepID=A0A9P1MYN2_9PELO|nr:unnamed protein product [Caenorhabditis angaria]